MRIRALTRPARPARLAALPRAAICSAAVLGLALSATGCNAGRPPAASVEGRDISVERIDELAAAFIEADPDTYAAQIEGAGEGTYAMDAMAGILNTIVIQLAQAELAEREGATPNTEEQAEAESLVRNSFAAGAEGEPDPTTGQPTEEQAAAQEASAKVFDALSEDTQQWLIDLRATTLALARVAAEGAGDTDAQAREIYEADPSAFESLCLRAVVVATTDTAAVQARLDAGEDLGAVSAEVSTTPDIAGAQGELGCVPSAQLGQYFPEDILAVVSTLEVGVVSEPVDLPDGTTAWFDLTEVQRLSFEEAREQIVASLPDPGEAALAELVQGSIGDLDIDIDPRFGTWDASTGTITPPDGARVPEADAELVDGGAPSPDPAAPVASEPAAPEPAAPSAGG